MAGQPRHLTVARRARLAHALGGPHNKSGVGDRLPRVRSGQRSADTASQGPNRLFISREPQNWPLREREVGVRTFPTGRGRLPSYGRVSMGDP
jgi:hypothetical protein